ncbi:MAG: hypothetical protein KFB93_04970 [Simkaniaceae bacterium]|nr:MAG: hypothetical protein KFB93_04970 [Simkaniaceae bacterium]
MELLARFSLNVFFGSLVTFYMTYFFILLFRLLIKSPRALYLLFLLPFIKIFSDLLFSSHSQWVFQQGEYVLKQPENSRTLNALIGYKGACPFAALKFNLQDGQLFSFGDVFSEFIGESLTLFIGLALIILTILSLARFGLHLRKSALWKKALLNETYFYDRYKGVVVYSTTRDLQSPILVGIWKPIIICPDLLLKTFSYEEKMAIFSHEKEHVLWKDNFVNGFIHGICAFFWFIPFKKTVLQKATYYRELGCDAKGDPLHLATALKKTQSINLPIGSIAFSSSFNRIKWILEKKGPGKLGTVLSFIFFLGGALFIFGSQFLPF